MKSKICIPVLLFALLLMSVSFAQNETFVDKAPIKFTESIIPNATVGVPSNGTQALNLSAKPSPIFFKELIGYIEGNVDLTGSFPYNFEEVENVLMEAGSYSTYPDEFGNYQIIADPGTYDVTATLYGYAQQIIPDVLVLEGGTVSNLDFLLPTINGRLMGNITYENTNDPIENATITILDTDFETTSTADGTYELIFEEGIYSVIVEYPGYMPQSINNVVVIAETNTQLDFELQPQGSCPFSVELLDDYGDGWNGNTLTIYVDGNVVLDNITLDTGFGPETFYFETSNSSEVICEYIGSVAQWDYENSYYIYNSDGDEVFADGLNGVAPTGGSLISLCPWQSGTLTGYLTDCITGEPIEGGEIGVLSEVTITGADGNFWLGLPIGTWQLSYSAPGYCPSQEIVMVTIIGGVITDVENLCLYPSQFEVDPLTINVELEPNGQTTEILTLSNTGYCDIDWSATVLYNNENGTDDLFELIWEMPVGVGGGEAGIETNGNFIYTTKWNGADFYRYGMDGIFIETLTCGAASGVRDMAFDGTYFYGGAASTTIFEMDLDNEILVSTFSAPTDCRAIAYNENEDVFYANNWGSDIVKFDKAGNNLGSFLVGPVGDSYYGFAYDGYSSGSPFLWGFAQVGTMQCELVQIQLPDGIETGLTFDVSTVLSASDLAGGLAIDDHIVSGEWAFLGTCQNVNIWALGLAHWCGWIILDPYSGTIQAGESIDYPVYFDATGLLPGLYNAEIVFATNPNIGETIVDVTLEVIGLAPPINLYGSYDCTDICFWWELPSGSNPNSFNIYRDGELIANITEYEFCEYNVIPEVEYCYQVTAVYESGESMPTLELCITVPTPDDLEPYDLEAIMDMPNENDVTLIWEEPLCCVSPDGYNIYRDNIKVNDNLVTELTFVETLEPSGLYEYYVTAVYYFGESESSNLVYVLYYGTDELSFDRCKLFPNPAKRLLNVQSDFKVKLLQIYDNQGQIIFTEILNQTNTQIDVSKFEPGLYFVQLEIEEKTILRKIVVE